jgi:2-phospho-L-lactate guanylyltransferase
MKKLAIIIPVKAPSEGKSRLAGVLSALDRETLNWRLLAGTLDQVTALADLGDVVVVSKSAAVLAEAARRHFAACAEPELGDLNDAVAIGADHAQQVGAREIMVLPVDLPWLSSHQLRQVVDDSRADGDVTIITDRQGCGTNVLLWRPAALAQFHYGIGSAARHAETAAGLGLRVSVQQDARLSFDLDTPQDLACWLGDEAASHGPTRRMVG